MDATPEFLSYHQGIYVPTKPSDSETPVIAVQILGWGAEHMTQYWIAQVSSWPLWGENERFEPCSTSDCHGVLCASGENRNLLCEDDPTFTDIFGNNCAWYEEYDRKCLLNPDLGQLDACPRTCRTCMPIAPRAGEMCGYVRIQVSTKSKFV